MPDDLIAHDRLLSIIHYDPETGLFSNRVTRAGNSPAGRILGSPAGGGSKYLHAKIDGVFYLLHRLAWFYVHGLWPDEQIDHRDMNPTNNAIANLREASPSQQKSNMKAQRRNKTGYKGVQFCKKSKKYRAFAAVNLHSPDRKLLRSKGYATPQEAHTVYCEFMRAEFGSYFRP